MMLTRHAAGRYCSRTTLALYGSRSQSSKIVGDARPNFGAVRSILWFVVDCHCRRTSWRRRHRPTYFVLPAITPCHPRQPLLHTATATAIRRIGTGAPQALTTRSSKSATTWAAAAYIEATQSSSIFYIALLKRVKLYLCTWLGSWA